MHGPHTKNAPRPDATKWSCHQRAHCPQTQHPSWRIRPLRKASMVTQDKRATVTKDKDIDAGTLDVADRGQLANNFWRQGLGCKCLLMHDGCTPRTTIACVRRTLWSCHQRGPRDRWLARLGTQALGRAIDPARNEKLMRLAGNSWRAALTAGPTRPVVFDRSCAGGILIADRQTGCPMKRNACASSVLGLSLLNFASGQGAYPHAKAANPYTLLEPIQFFPGWRGPWRGPSGW